MKKLIVKAPVIVQEYKPPVLNEIGEIIEQEIPGITEIQVIAETQGTDEELAIWLAGDVHKYPVGYELEYIDISTEVEQEKINQEALAYLASTDWLIIREIDAGVFCPLDVKQKRQEARNKIIK